MGRQDFSALVESGLLRDVEQIVVDAHRSLSEREGRRWAPSDAYRWLRYEDSDPVGRLAEGVENLRKGDAEFAAEAVDKACIKAAKSGFLN